MALFAIQHKGMARKRFKDCWTQYVPKRTEEVEQWDDDQHHRHEAESNDEDGNVLSKDIFLLARP
ncbi:hypothetical protein IVA95_28695 [Bradyrhizobium sp. 157]|uniref:hypothetical protein n=1 Tax=Bradyrhizobium sp. 157 TaxID=2782631 RepID=UPI001FFA9755|nr:hypothetical protein [Bradyrhizobium sp. 157]MCK1641427.1 hypothetical protein [Bradyrhizobium sp. 157]